VATFDYGDDMQPQADKTTQTHKTVLTVKHSMQGRWEVCDAAQEERPLADFDTRDDALEYARGVAGTKPEASVQTFDQWGEPELRESYVRDAASGRSVRAS
jgi:hypothetical protein